MAVRQDLWASVGDLLLACMCATADAECVFKNIVIIAQDRLLADIALSGVI
jgi:hypothetical protein